MKWLVWKKGKPETLYQERGLTTDDVEEGIRSALIDTIEGTEKYPGQRIFVVRINGYIHAVPFTECSDHILIETAFPSRKLNKKYGGRK